MIPARAQVTKLLEDAKRQPHNKYWVKHCYGVGDAAGKIADALNQNNHNLDPEKITLMGYLHDIGKTFDPWVLHPKNGYDYLKKLGYDKEYCEICLTHSFVNNDAFCMFSEFMEPERDQFVIDFITHHEFTLEEKIIALCDMMYGTEMWTLDKRIVDIISRHGTGPQTADRIRATNELKTYIDHLLGYNLYQLFPEVKENL